MNPKFQKADKMFEVKIFNFATTDWETIIVSAEAGHEALLKVLYYKNRFEDIETLKFNNDKTDNCLLTANVKERRQSDDNNMFNFPRLIIYVFELNVLN